LAGAVLLTVAEIDPVRPTGARDCRVGAIAEFRGVGRSLEHGKPISAIEYEAYEPMAERVIRTKLEAIGSEFGLVGARVIHRLGLVRVGEVSIFVELKGQHRAEVFRALPVFMDQLKADVPIWKSRTLFLPDTAQPAS